MKVIAVGKPSPLEVAPLPTQTVLSCVRKSNAAEGKQVNICSFIALCLLATVDVMPFNCFRLLP